MSDSKIIKEIDTIASKDIQKIIPYMGAVYSQRVRMFAKSRSISLLHKTTKSDRIEIINDMLETFEKTDDTWLQRNILEVASHFYSDELKDYFLQYARNGCKSEYIKDRILTLYDLAYRRNRK